MSNTSLHVLVLFVVPLLQFLPALSASLALHSLNLMVSTHTTNKQLGLYALRH